MKKIIYSLIAIIFVFSLVAISVAQAEDSGQNHATDTPKLERIPSPAYIQFFQMIRREGNTLFGIRKATTTPRLEPKKFDETASSTKLEKIDHPSLISMFEKIQRIGTTLWGIRKKATSTPFIITPEMATCVATAINVKDKALIARVSSAATELNAALLARSACQQTAVIATTTPRDALNVCVKTFNAAHKTIKEASKKVQNDTWKIYKNSLQACQTTATSTSSVLMIEDGESIFD